MELKTHQYNYDDAASTGKGPAYVMGPLSKVDNYCELPGCYINSDFLSDTNSSWEYNEPQVAIGVDPERSTEIVAERDYYADINSVVGRGNRSLLKIRYYTTKRLAPFGVSGIFHCDDVLEKTLLEFQDNIYSPACVQNEDIWSQKCPQSP